MVKGLVVYRSFKLMVPVGNSFCNKCDGSGYKHMWFIERLWHCFWQKLTLEDCSEHKACKCLYYIDSERYD